jgi:hypothetical protein
LLRGQDGYSQAGWPGVRIKINCQSPGKQGFNNHLFFEGFVRYLAVRISDQQQIIANLVTEDSEQRQGKTLLRLARTLGKKDPRSIRIELKISAATVREPRDNFQIVHSNSNPCRGAYPNSEVEMKIRMQPRSGANGPNLLDKMVLPFNYLPDG